MQTLDPFLACPRMRWIPILLLSLSSCTTVTEKAAVRRPTVEAGVHRLALSGPPVASESLPRRVPGCYVLALQGLSGYEVPAAVWLDTVILTAKFGRESRVVKRVRAVPGAPPIHYMASGWYVGKGDSVRVFLSSGTHYVSFGLQMWGDSLAGRGFEWWDMGPQLDSGWVRATRADCEVPPKGQSG